jgi:hypothetical protein
MPLVCRSTLERIKASQLGPPGRPAAGRPNSDELAGAHGRARAGKWSVLSQGSISRLGWVGDGASKVARQRPAVAAAASHTPARRRFGLDKVRHEEVLQLLGKRLGPTRDCGRCGGGSSACEQTRREATRLARARRKPAAVYRRLTPSLRRQGGRARGEPSTAACGAPAGTAACGAPTGGWHGGGPA